ncbi:relaxase, partial [Arthrobacter deserti]|nr:relaxase [Arthrobacter deserti]
GRAPCRWAAVRHGKSKKGNDHIHLVVSMVREDGTKFNDWKSHYRSQQVCRDLERQHGLTVLGILHAERGYTPAEQTRAEREERPEIHRHTLARLVRACAAASLDEAEFVRRARTTGLLLRPRYAAGRGDVVPGYSAALRPPRGERPIWFGGNTLARDLALPWLRINWADTPESAAAALAEWDAAARHRRPAAPGREVLMPGPDAWKQYAHQVGELREKLASVPAGDWTAWAQAARDTAAAFAAWSRRTEPVPGPLADASRELARAAQLRHYPHPAVRAPLPSAGGAAMILLAASPPASREAYALLFRQLANTALAIHAMHAAAGDVRLLRGLGGAILRATETIRASAPASTPGDPAGAGTPQEPGLRPAGTDLPAAGGLRPGSPLPAPLTKHNREPAAHRSPGRRPGLER